mmetsp:Transcript_22302/g.53044  ORF Transcript_22302/g.53044 Transcript_22302/m.53044 type:complete len:80 (-) Transcript_22302:617-856(-)
MRLVEALQVVVGAKCTPVRFYAPLAIGDFRSFLGVAPDLIGTTGLSKTNGICGITFLSLVPYNGFNGNSGMEFLGCWSR